MTRLKSLIKDTALCGLSGMIGRFLNCLLVPLYTAVLPAASSGYGVVTNAYAQAGSIMVLSTFGIETGFLRSASKSEEGLVKICANSLISVGGVSLIFAVPCLTFLQPVSNFLDYGNHPDFIRIMIVVMALDSFLCIPFAYPHYRKRPIKFVAIKFVSITANIVLSLFFLLFYPWLHVHFPASVDRFYNPTHLIGCIFVTNLITTCLQLFYLIPEFRGFAYRMDKTLLKRMLVYSFPILTFGLIGILSQAVGKTVYPFLSTDRQEGLVQLGIYGAVTKIAMVMTTFAQVFHYAYEPFVLGREREGNNHRMYAQVMEYFLIFALLAFLTVMFYLDILRYMVTPDCWTGLSVVAIVIGMEMFRGIYFNLSFWYKLIDETRWGAYFSMVECAVIVEVNVLLVPTYGFVASAWASVAGYGVITVLSYWIGQKKYPIHYDLEHLGMYMLLTAVLYAVGELVPVQNVVLRLAFHTVLLLISVAYVIRTDLPLSQTPMISRLIKKK